MGGGMGGMGMSMCNPDVEMCPQRNLRGEVLIDFEEHKAPPLPKTYSYNPSLFNVEWESFDRLEQFSNALQCGNLPSDRPIHGVDTWHQLRQTYEDVVGPQRSSISRVLAEAKDMPVAAQDSNSLSVEHVPGKGRGLVAAKDIKKGEKMWSDVYVAEFFDRDDLNRYLAVLPTDLACDVILWTYNIEEDPTKDFYFSVDLDLGTFCNNGGSEHTNLVWEAKEDVYVNTAVASRDIAAGEEVLCNYGYGAGDDDDGEE